jgi:hydrogenase nickel incorporation protein HypB
LTEKGIFAVNAMGGPGIGKTTVLKNLIANMKEGKPYVIEGDIESDLDARTLRALGVRTFQINTFGACHLDAPLVRNAAQNFDFDAPGILFIENVGNLVCPAEFSIGEHMKLLVCSVTEGGDKPYKYPLAFEKADLILLNKVDLLPYLDFDEDFFMKGLRALNPEAPVIKASAKTGEGFAEAMARITQMSAAVRAGGNGK